MVVSSYIPPRQRKTAVSDRPSWRLRLFAVAACICGLTGLALFFAFLILGGLELWSPRSDFEGGAAVGWNALLLIVFALQHSGMARETFKRWEARWLPAHAERVAYVGVSGLAT